jgi:hypothetical protein
VYSHDGKAFQVVLLHIFPQMPEDVGIVILVYGLPLRNKLMMYNSINVRKKTTKLVLTSEQTSSHL